MNNLGISIDQIIIGIFCVVLIVSTLRKLNNCSKETAFTVRMPLILFFTAAVGTLLLLLAGVQLQWSHSLAVVGLAVHMFAERRQYPPKISPKFEPKKLN